MKVSDWSETPVVFGACFILDDRAGYPGWGVEDPLCTSFDSSTCTTYSQCPPGVQCKLVNPGYMSLCIPGTATVKQYVFQGGSPVSTLNSCCQGGTQLPPAAVTLTCVVPADTFGGTRCMWAIN